MERYLGHPDCYGPEGGHRYGSERTYLGTVGVEHIRAVNPGAEHVYHQVTYDLIGQHIKFEGFPWLTLLRADSASLGDVVEVRSWRGLDHAKVTALYAHWADLALIRTRRIPGGPAALT